MFKFLVQVELLGDFSFIEVNQVKTLFEEALKKSNNENDVEEYMEERMPTILKLLATEFVIMLFKVDNSYELGICVENKICMMMTAHYLDLSSLRNISTYKIALLLKHKMDVEYLAIPETLKDDIEPVWEFLDDMNTWPEE